MKVYDWLLRIYVEVTLRGLPKQKYTTLKAPEPEPVKMPSLISAIILALAVMGAALLGVDFVHEVQKP